MPDSDLGRALRRFRRELLANERAAASEMVRVYGQAWQRVQDILTQLDTEYRSREALGQKPGPDWIYQYNRARAFRDQVEGELNKFTQYAEQSTRGQMQAAIEAAEKHAERLTRTALGKPPSGAIILWNRISTAAVAEMVGLTQTDSPLHKLLAGISGEGAQVAEDALVQGMAMGKNPRAVAPLLRQALGTTLTRALRITRTETLRAYREATRQSYQANGDVLEGWIWHAALDTRTCAACWTMHGTIHKLDEILDDHPNGRCAMQPLTKTWADIGEAIGVDLTGIEETRVTPELGVDVFVRLAAEEQIKILGPAKFAAWENGEFDLQDLIGRRQDPIWGGMRYEKSLKEILGAEVAKRWYVLPRAQDYEAMRDQLVSHWTEGSKRPLSVVMKMALQREFGLEGTVYNPNNYAFREGLVHRYQKIVRKMYEETQADLLRRNIKEIQLYRGLKEEVFRRGVIESYTSDQDTAIKFDGFVVLSEKVNASRVFMFYDGPGWKNGSFGQQWEYLVLFEEPT